MMIVLVSIFCALIIFLVLALYFWSLSKGYAVMPEASKIDPLPPEDEFQEEKVK